MSVTIQPDETGAYPKTVFIDGRQLRKQIIEDPIVKDGLVIVCCLTDNRLSNCEDPGRVPYQAKPYEQFIGKDGMTVTRFYFKHGS